MKEKLRNILISLPTIVVFISTLLLLTYIGYGEASRTYLNFQLRKLSTQAQIIKKELEPHLNAGLPLIQFSGFNSLSNQLLKSDDSIENIQIFDTKDNRVFLGIHEEITKQDFTKIASSRSYVPLPADKFSLSNANIVSSDLSYRVVVPLDNKFGPVGSITIEALKDNLLKANNEKYEFVFYSFIILSLCFILVNLIYEFFFVRTRVRDRLIKGLYIIGFLSMSIIIGISVFYIYKDGVELQTKALSDSIAQRVNAVFDLGIGLDDLSGVNELVKDYQEQNPDISRIVLTKQNTFYYHTDSNLVGSEYYSLKDNYEYLVPLKDSLEGEDRDNEVAVSFSFKKHLIDANIFVLSLSFPIDIVTRIVFLNAKNFIVLFISCGLIALIFLKAGTSFINVFERLGKVDMASLYFMSYANKDAASSSKGSDSTVDYGIGINLIKPVYFLVVFVNALSISFLPQLVTEMSKVSTSSFASASLPFTVFYIFFAMILLPAGQYAERGNLRRLMAFGFLFEVIGLGILIVTNNYWLFVVGRAFSGIGQGLFLIGLQSYLLVIVPRDKKTEGASVKVFGRNAALIAGASIGALLYSYIDYKTVFTIAFALSVVGIVYLQAIIPEVRNMSKPSSKGASKFSQLFINVGSVFKDIDFVRTFFLVGLLGKMSITGVVMFAVPILLMQLDFAPEDIGQALMLYYISSMLMNQFVSRLVKGLGGTNLVLFMSAIVGGVGMLIFGLVGITAASDSKELLDFEYLTLLGNYVNGFINGVDIAGFKNYVILSCLVLTGISNGLLTAPIITHISNTKVAFEKGDKSITATYTFLERGGHVMGPMVVSYLFTLTNHNQSSIAFFGIITIVLGFLFILFARRKKKLTA